MAYIDGPISDLSGAMTVHTYTLTMAKDGNGTIVPDEGDHLYMEDRPAILAALPDTGWIFDEWDGDDVDDQGNPFTMVIMDSDKSVTGVFKEAVTLTIIATGGGSTSPPSGVITPFIKGSTATVKAAPIDGYEFTEWTGDLVSANDVDTILMDADKTIGCIFRPKVDPASIYSKLYYGTDTKKAYWNVDNQWTFFATIRHSLLEELGDDSHLQYHTDIRGDARYYKKSEVEALIDALTFDLTAHKASADHDGRYYTKTQLNNIIADLTFADVVRQAFDNTDTIEVIHNMGRRPMVQVQGSAVSDYGAGLYGAGAYGGILPYTVLAPSSIEHSLDSNKVMITLASDYTGEVICVG